MEAQAEQAPVAGSTWWSRGKPLTKRGRWLLELWAYAVMVAFVVGGAAWGLSGQYRLIYPIIGICAFVGIIGSLLAVLRSLDDNTEARASDSIFR